MRYSVTDVFNMLGTDALTVEFIDRKSRDSVEVEGYQVYRQSLRYATFYQKGCTCAACGKVGTYFELDPGDNISRKHFNLYADDGTLMTKDHIVPKKHGGKNTISNMQTMCVTCNCAKGANLC
jgi:5-methylcytosine-specific restriction endonuclease McrA